MLVSSVPPLLVLIAVFSVAPAAAQCLKYEPTQVTVRGKIFERTDFGPPNYGENPKTDSREEHLYLRLDHAICVGAADNSESPDDAAERNISVIQMLYYRKQFERTWLGRHVFVHGTLFHSFSAHHWTNVLIDVQETRVL